MSRDQLTIQQHAKFVVENAVSDYEEKTSKYTYWEVLAMIKHAYEINAFNKGTAERFCYHMNCTFDEMMTA